MYQRTISFSVSKDWFQYFFIGLGLFSLFSIVFPNLGLKKKEEEYLHILVNFDQAKNHKEKDLFFQQILKTRIYKQIRTMDTEHYQFFSHWYIPVIRELVVHKKYDGTPAWIIKRIEPTISESKVNKGIDLLNKLGLIN